MTVQNKVLHPQSVEEERSALPLHVRIAHVESSLAKELLQEAAEIFSGDVLNITALEKCAKRVTEAGYTHAHVVEHPNIYLGICVRITFGVCATDPHLNNVWIPVDSRFMTR